jgi:membrane protease YdiL (CAAX protease family)
MTQTFAAILMLYGPFAWCYLRKEPYESYGLFLRWNREITLKLLFYCAATLIPLTVVAMHWPGEDLPRKVTLMQFFTYATAGLLRRRFTPLPGIVLSAAIFAASHMLFRTSPIFLATFFPGLFMAQLREEFHSIAPAIAYHFMGNLWAIWFFPGV